MKSQNAADRAMDLADALDGAVVIQGDATEATS